MNFEPFNRGIYSLMVSVGIAVGSMFPTPTHPSANPQLQKPQIEQVVNLPSPSPSPLENYNLELPSESTPEASTQPSMTPSPSAKVKEASIAVVTVEKPVKPSKKPSPTPKPSPAASEKASPTPAPSSSSAPLLEKLVDNAEKLFAQINDHRKSLGLAAFEKDERICKIAEQRAPQIHDEVFGEGPIHKGFKALNLSYWATENAAAYESLEQNLKFWLSDSIHKKAIEGDSKYSCIACSGTSCSEIFTSFTPKN